MAQQPKLGSPIRSWWIGCDEQRFYRFRLYSSTVSTRYKYQKLELRFARNLEWVMCRKIVVRVQ